MEKSREVINNIEMSYPVMMDRFKKIIDEQYELFCRKQYDYGSQNITLGGDLDKDEDRMLALEALWIAFASVVLPSPRTLAFFLTNLQLHRSYLPIVLVMANC